MREEEEQVSLECINKEQPTCPECHEPLRESTSGTEDYKFAAIDAGIYPSATVRCLECGERIKITVKRLYDTEVVTTALSRAGEMVPSLTQCEEAGSVREETHRAGEISNL
jgi:RNase P subunit RPR2